MGIFKDIMFFYNNLWKGNGLVYTVKYSKLARLYATRYFSGQPLHIHGILPVRVKIKDNFPLVYHPLLSLFYEGDRWDKVFCMTFLSLSRAFVPDKYTLSKIKLDTKSIEDLPKGKRTTLDVGVLRKIISKMSLRDLEILDLESTDYKYFTSKGPLGQSTNTAHLSIQELSLPTLDSLSRLIGDYSQEIVGFTNLTISKNLRFFQDTGLEPFSGSHLTKGEFGVSRKIAVIRDPELKMRPVAIFDWHSQTVLDKLSRQVYSMLKTIPMDRTFTQNPYFTHRDTTPVGQSYHSLDLSSATDRFPLDLQLQIIDLLDPTGEIGPN